MISAMEIREELAEVKRKVKALLLHTDSAEFRRGTSRERQLVMLRLNALRTYGEACALTLGECWWEDPAAR